MKTRGQCTASLQFGTQIYSYSSSNENKCSKSSIEPRMGEKFGVESGESQKQIWRDRWSKKQGCESAIGICHLKNAELQKKHQNHRGRVVLRGDIVKDDAGSNAVFTEQGSSASQMTAAKVMDIVSRLPGFAGHAGDALSAYPQVRMEEGPKLLKVPKSECPDTWIRLPRHKWPKS